jgi:hypothetical protein
LDWYVYWVLWILGVLVGLGIPWLLNKLYWKLVERKLIKLIGIIFWALFGSVIFIFLLLFWLIVN